MKKTIIATSILLAASIISVVCFGVALGGQIARGVFDPESEVNKWIEKYGYYINGNHIVDEKTENDYNINIGSYFWNEENGTLISTNKVEINPSKTEALLNRNYKIDVDIAKINVVSTDSDSLICTLKQYSNGADTSKDSYYSLSNYDNTIEVDIENEMDAENILAVLTVEIPKNVEINNLEIDLDLGKMIIKDACVKGSLNVSIGSGTAELASGKSKSCEAKVTAGTLRIENFLADSFNIKVPAGKAEIYLPVNESTTLNYDVMGKVYNNAKSVKGLESSNGMKKKKIVQDKGTGTMINYNIDVVGTLTFYDKETI